MISRIFFNHVKPFKFSLLAHEIITGPFSYQDRHRFLFVMLEDWGRSRTFLLSKKTTRSSGTFTLFKAAEKKKRHDIDERRDEKRTLFVRSFPN